MRTRLLLLIMILMPAMSAHAQYLFHTLSRADGLSSKEAYGFYNDSLGFMWIGTANGLNRYDGSRFKLYTSYTKASPGLPTEEIGGITEHGRGRLYIGTRTGLCYLDRNTGRFVPVPLIRGKDTVPKPAVFLVYTDFQKRLWVASGKGLFLERNGVMMAISATYPSAAAMDTFPCDATPSGNNGLYLRNDAELRYMDCSTGILYSRAHNPEHWPILEDSSYSILVPGPDGRIWFSRKGAGLGWFDPRTNKVYIFPAWKDKMVHTMFFDSKGRFWLCETTHHAFVMTEEGVFKELFSNPDDPYSIAYPYFHDVYEDRQHNLWFSTLNGISILPAQPVLQALITLPGDAEKKDIKSQLAYSLVPADSTHMWICRNGEILLMDTRSYSMRRFTFQPEDHSAVRYFDIQKMGGAWLCATTEGVLQLNVTSGKFTRLKAQPEGWVKEARAVIWIREDGAGNRWCANWNDAIYRFNIHTQKWDKMSEGPGPVKSLFGFTDKRGRLWAGYGAKGVRWYNEQVKSWVNPLEHEKVFASSEKFLCTAVAEDAQGSKWVATDRKGVIRINEAGQITDSISIRDGLYSNRAGNLWLQPDGRLWLSTSEGLQHTMIMRKQLSGFALTTGISVSNYSYPILQMGDTLYTGMNGRLAVIDLKALATSQAASPKPLLTGIKVLGDDVSLPYDAPELKLDHDRNFFSIEYSSPLHKEVQSLSYSYMLKGFDKDWVAAGRNQLASYTGVPPGHYRFLVRTTNADGEWSQHIAALPVHILPPFWMQWWGVVLEILLLAALGYAIYKNALRRQRNRQMGRAVSYFANSVHGHNSVSEICWDIARNCISQMGLEDCVVYLRDEHRPVLIQKAAYGPKDAAGFAIANPIEIEVGKGIVGAVAASGKPMLVKDTRKDPRYVVDDAQRASELAVPIIHDREVIGVIDSEHSKKNFYKKAHLMAFTTIASITANKIAEAQAEAEVAEKALQLLEIQKLLAESQLMALRAQMNPHFVFNCLNSIQECIVTAKYGEASLYLNKFSKLFRMLLNNSGRGMISLAEEIEVLTLYLSLEHMRFERSFDYNIEVDEDLETSEILIPSMLLQPFVENALWHGLMHKESDRRLLITFQSISDELFRCTIDDNGIGREKAKLLKAAKSSGNTHQSKGMQITADRVELMQRQGQAASIKILDKKDVAGNAAGTTIIIELSAYLTAAS